MKAIKNSILIISGWIILFFSSCVEEFNAQLPDSEISLLVVDGNIVSDSTCVFSLSRSFSLNEEGIPEDYNQIKADVYVKGSDGSLYTSTALGKGKYSVEVGKLNPQQTYYLEILWEGNTYTSTPQYPLITEDLSLKFTQPDENGPVNVHFSTEPTTSNEPAYYTWNYIEDWEIRTTFRTNAEFNPDDGRIIIYEDFPYAQGWAHQESQEIYIHSTANFTDNRFMDKILYSIPNTDHRLSHLYSTFVIQRKMTKGEYEYYQCKERFTNDMGGLFTPQPSELPTNLSCSDKNKRVIGYVGVNMNVSIQQLYIPTTEINFLQKNDCINTEQDELITKLSNIGVENTFDLYLKDYRVSYYLDRGIMMPPLIRWAERKCVDCRYYGADPNGRPEFWPDF